MKNETHNKASQHRTFGAGLTNAHRGLRRYSRNRNRNRLYIRNYWKTCYLRCLLGIGTLFSATCYAAPGLEDFSYDATVAVNFSSLVIADFIKVQTPPLKTQARDVAQTGSFIDHAGRRFVYVLFREPDGNGVYNVVSEICTGFGTATHEYHVSDFGISAYSAEELMQSYRSMKTDRTADLPLACPPSDEFKQP